MLRVAVFINDPFLQWRTTLRCELLLLRRTRPCALRPIDSLHCMACADVDSATACAQEANFRDELVQVAKDAAIGSFDQSAGTMTVSKPVNWLLSRSGKLRALAMLYPGFKADGFCDYKSRDLEFKQMYSMLQALVVASTGCGTKYGKEPKTVLGILLYPDGKPKTEKSHVVHLKVCHHLR